MLSTETITMINATVPAVEQNARAITECFYPLLFKRYPATRDFFNMSHQTGGGSQRQALANAVVAYAKNIERLEALGPAVSLITNKHVSLGILPEHYPLVGECLLAAIAEVLGEAATEEVLKAWGAAYGQLVDILVAAESSLYQANKQRQGGWQGEQQFTVVAKEYENDVICSLYLAPQKIKGPITFSAGQYIALVLNINGQTVRRNYSLSDAPGKNTLRISVKREHEGLVSNYLHDTIKVGDNLNVTAPAGDFILKPASRPLVLLTAGVGITPAISMLNSIAPSSREVIFIHAAQNSQHHAFKAHVDDLSLQYGNIKPYYIYDQPLAGDTPHAKGFITSDLLASLLPADANVDVYFLGPKPFMQSVNKSLKLLNIPPEQIAFEFFGPLQALDAA